jgi:hypothetical protein
MPVLREKFTKQLKQKRWNGRSFFQHIGEMEPSDRLILSDENILGGMSAPVGLFYPNARGRLAAVRRLFRDFDLEVHVTIRNYEDYLVSRYSEFLRHFDFLPFDQYYSRIRFDQASWRDLIFSILDVFDAPVKVYEFDSIVKDNKLFFDEILAKKQIELSVPEERPDTRRARVSRETYGILGAVAQNYGSATVRPVLRLLETKAQLTDTTPFNPLTRVQANGLANNYAKLKQGLIRSDNVKFIN